MHLLKGQGISFLVIGDLVVPQGDLRDFAGVLPVLVAHVQLQAGDLADAVRDTVHDFVVVGVVAVQHGDARMGAGIVVPHPKAEAGEARGEGGHPEREGLQRSIAPRLVVGREQGEVQAAKQVVIRHVEHAVVAVQVGRDEIHLHLVADPVHESGFPEAAGDGVVFGVHQVVRDLGLVLRVAVAGELLDQAAVGTVMAGRDEDERLDATAFIVGPVELVQGVDEHVDALVAELVPAADADEDGVGGHFLGGHRRRHLDQAFPGRVVQPDILLVGGGGEGILETVGRDHIDGALQELGAFLRGDLAHRREHVGLAGSHLLQGVEGHDAEALRHLVPIEVRHVVIEPEVVPGEAASDDRRVGREDRSDGDVGPLELQDAGAGLPLVELGHGVVGR